MKGAGIVRASWATTAVLAVAAVAGVAVPGVVRTAAGGIATGLFLAGIAVYFWAYAIAVGRSRTVELGIGGLFFLAGDVAPPAPRRQLQLSAGLQVAIALGGAALRPFTATAFLILAPVVGLALMGLWGARHGEFEPRRSAPESPRGRSPKLPPHG